MDDADDADRDDMREVDDRHDEDDLLRNGVDEPGDPLRSHPDDDEDGGGESSSSGRIWDARLLGRESSGTEVADLMLCFLAPPSPRSNQKAIAAAGWSQTSCPRRKEIAPKSGSGRETRR
jgi:hypothetical protein